MHDTVSGFDPHPRQRQGLPDPMQPQRRARGTREELPDMARGALGSHIGAVLRAVMTVLCLRGG
jgi:hypothetical protein